MQLVSFWSADQGIVNMCCLYLHWSLAICKASVSAAGSTCQQLMSAATAHLLYGLLISPIHDSHGAVSVPKRILPIEGILVLWLVVGKHKPCSLVYSLFVVNSASRHVFSAFWCSFQAWAYCSTSNCSSHSRCSTGSWWHPAR